jgi:hypothetical protein
MSTSVSGSTISSSTSSSTASTAKKSQSLSDALGGGGGDETVPFTTMVARTRRLSSDEGSGALTSKSVDMTRSVSDVNELIPTSLLGHETRELYTALRAIVPLKTRMSGFFRHTRCFLGSDFIDCAMRRFELPTVSATQLLAQFEHAFVVRCLAFDKKDAGKTLYRFIDDEKSKDRRDLEERNVTTFHSSALCVVAV